MESKHKALIKKINSHWTHRFPSNFSWSNRGRPGGFSIRENNMRIACPRTLKRYIELDVYRLAMQAIGCLVQTGFIAFSKEV